MNYNRIVLDQYDEINSGLQKEADLAKAAGVESLANCSDISRLEDDDFAVVIVKEGEKYRRFPINNKENTGASKEAFLRNWTKMTVDAHAIAGNRLKVACSRYGIDASDIHVDKIGDLSPYFLHTHLKDIEHETKLAEQTLRKEAAMQKFAINEELNGHPIQKFRINTEDEVVKAASEISTKLPVKWFAKAARATLDRAAELGVSIPYDADICIVKNAELSDLFGGEIRKRIRMSSGSGAVQYMDLLNKSASADLASIAVELEALDESLGHRSKWAHALFCPAVAVWGIPKKAETIDMGTSSIESGKLSEFAAENRSQLASAIGEDAVQSLIDDPTVAFRALPAPHRQYIAENFGGSA